MDFKDYYKILGVEKKATQDEIKKAFRSLAVKYHPDKNAGNKEAEENFKSINEANGVLSNPEKRAKYDEFGQYWENPGQDPQNYKGQNTSQGRYQDFGDQADFSDLFEQFFSSKNGNTKTAKNAKGGDYETEMEITLQEAYHGTSRILQVDKEKLRITTKPGTFSGQILRVKNKGAAPRASGERGDLYVKIKVKSDSEFERKQNDLYISQSVDLFTVILGGDILIHTFTGQVKINLQAGTQNAKVIRLKGKGMPIYDKTNQFGDLYATLQVKIPENLSLEQKAKFEELKAIL
ncbi:DnaJ C-terminal domain-containing protein [Lacihabitans sp. CS3-21]|uniref:DnaJ C-terminal domain-containing protein n=1 Tax=Lacihabitans sp. CS3-21 TaxID=2487332 RepID=UPI0020CDF490|nr:J domain-containing protein [Lacihabitans sp. CS3-21]MCP9746829.1 J domain-containing protein [Lacihabitans sp. CS3-21]